jgi:hypothetical protein
MPTNRRIRRREATTRISPAALASYRLCHEIESAGADNTWEEEGGRRREYLDASTALDRSLGLPAVGCITAGL